MCWGEEGREGRWGVLGKRGGLGDDRRLLGVRLKKKIGSSTIDGLFHIGRGWDCLGGEMTHLGCVWLMNVDRSGVCGKSGDV